MNDDGFVLELALIVVLIFANGFFAAAEIAIVSARGSRLQAMADQGRRGAQAALRLKGDPDRFLATVQIGVTLVSTLASAVGGVAAIEKLEPLIASIPLPWAATVAEPLAVGGVVFGIAYLSLVVGELVPKAIAVRDAEVLAAWMAPLVETLSRITRAAVAVLTASTRACLRVLGRTDPGFQPFHTLEDLRSIAQEAQDQGVVHGDIVSGAVEFHERAVREVVTPRVRIQFLPADASLEEALKVVRATGHSRFPVHGRNLDDILGFVYARDVYEAALDARPLDLSKAARKALVVPESRPATALLADMRKGGIPVALAIDEHGTVTGLITIEDLVEVIVGEIRDEHAGAQEMVRVLPSGAIEAEGTVPLHELNGEHGLQLPESTAYVSVAGLVLDRLGALPHAHDSVRVGPYLLTVLRIQGRRVSRVRIDRIDGEGELPVGNADRNGAAKV